MTTAPYLSYASPESYQRKRPAQRFNPWVVAAIVFALAIIGVTYLISFYVAAILYGILVVALAAFAPHYAFMLIFASAPFAWDVSDTSVKMAVSELTFAASIPFLLIRTGKAGWKRLANPLWIPIIAYLGVATFSSIANGNVRESAIALAQMGLYLIACIFVFSVCLPNYRSIYPAFYGLIASTAFLALVVVFTLNPGPFGLHKNLVGTELMYAVVIAFELWLSKSVRRLPRILNIVLLMILVLGLVSSVSRGAWIGAFAGVFMVLMLRRQFSLAAKSLLLLIPILIFGWILLPEATKYYVTDISTSNNTSSAGTRVVSIEYAWSYFTTGANSEIYGVGVWLRKYSDATNVVVYTLAETGVVGLIAFMSIFATLLSMAWYAQKRIARTDPVFSLLVIGVAIMFSKLAHGLVDHYWSRGIIPVWAGGGLVAYAWCYARQGMTKKK